MSLTPHLLLAVMMLAVTGLRAQEPPAGKLSIMFHMGAATGASSSMNASLDDFRRDVLTGAPSVGYPCREFTLPPSLGGIQVVYRFPGSRLGAYVGGEWIRFRVTDTEGYAHMDLSTISLGAEYALWEPGRALRVFGRGGINGSSIGGELGLAGLRSYHIAINRGARLGLDGALGLRYIFPSEHFALEMTGGYMNANLIGRSFTPAQPSDQASGEGERELNDGADPGNPADRSSAIDLLLLRVGARLLF